MECLSHLLLVSLISLAWFTTVPAELDVPYLQAVEGGISINDTVIAISGRLHENLQYVRVMLVNSMKAAKKGTLSDGDRYKDIAFRFKIRLDLNSSKIVMNDRAPRGDGWRWNDDAIKINSIQPFNPNDTFEIFITPMGNSYEVLACTRNGTRLYTFDYRRNNTEAYSHIYIGGDLDLYNVSAYQRLEKTIATLPNCDRHFANTIHANFSLINGNSSQVNGSGPADSNHTDDEIGKSFPMDKCYGEAAILRREVALWQAVATASSSGLIAAVIVIIAVVCALKKKTLKLPHDNVAPNTSLPAMPYLSTETPDGDYDDMSGSGNCVRLPIYEVNNMELEKAASNDEEYATATLG